MPQRKPIIPSTSDDLRAILASKQGLQRTTRYEVFIRSPNGVLQWPALSVSLPGRSLDAVPDDLLSQGDNRRTIPIKRGYGGEPSVLLGFYIDSNWDIRTFFEDWADRFNPLGYNDINDVQANTLNTGSYENLVENSAVVIRFFNLQDEIQWEMSLIEPYISTIIQETYNEERLNELATLTVAIAFKEYTTIQY
tara:strand:- start:2363 stop:2944 length:582 start_codon:yes stop_codon:yes gene_type:complete